MKRRLTSRPNVKVPVDALLDQYIAAAQASQSILKNFDAIFIFMGFPRLSIGERGKLVAKLLVCEQEQEETQDK